MECFCREFTRGKKRHVSAPADFTGQSSPHPMNSLIVPSNICHHSIERKDLRREVSGAQQRDALELCLWEVRSSRSPVAAAETSGQELRSPRRSDVTHRKCVVYKLICKEALFLNKYCN